MPRDIFDQPPRLSPRGMAVLESGFQNNEEAHAVLALIVAEFETDPMSVQCFDARIVARAIACVKQRREADAGGSAGPADDARARSRAIMESEQRTRDEFFRHGPGPRSPRKG